MNYINEVPDLWDIFKSSGKITDYLQYKNIFSENAKGEQGNADNN